MVEGTQVVALVALTHDIAGGRSLATLVWTADPDKRITLPVPYGCGLENAAREAEDALRAFAIELGDVRVGPMRLV